MHLFALLLLLFLSFYRLYTQQIILYYKLCDLLALAHSGLFLGPCMDRFVTICHYKLNI